MDRLFLEWDAKKQNVTHDIVFKYGVNNVARINEDQYIKLKKILKNIVRMIHR